MNRLELHVVDVSESVCELNIGSMQKGEEEVAFANNVELVNFRGLVINTIRALRAGQAVVIVRRRGM